MLTQVWFEKKKRVMWQVGQRIIKLNVCGYYQDNFEMNCLHSFYGETRTHAHIRSTHLEVDSPSS